MTQLTASVQFHELAQGYRAATPDGAQAAYERLCAFLDARESSVHATIIATKDGEIAALTAEVTHLAEKLAERDASAGLMKQASETTLADFGGNQANYDAWKKFQASAAPQPVDAAQAVPEYAMCNDKGAVGFAPDNFQECPDCVAARACAQEGPEAVYQVFDNCNGEQWLTVSKAVYDRADLDLRRCWQPTDTTKGA